MFRKIYNFLFPDDTKIKVECSTDVFYSDLEKRVYIKRRFYTLRSIVTHYWYELFINPTRAIKELAQMKPYLFQVGAIAFDAASSAQVSSTSLTFAHTCTGTNLVLTVGHSSVRTATDCTYNSVTMTGTTEATSGSGFARLFYLGNPATGANNVVLTLGSSGDVKAGAISLSGANSSSPLDNQAQNSVVASTSITMTMTTNYANSMLVDSVQKQADPTVDASQTLRWSNTTGDFGGGSTKPTTAVGSYSMTWTGTSAAWSGTAIAVREYVAPSVNSNFFSFFY